MPSGSMLKVIVCFALWFSKRLWEHAKALWRRSHSWMH